MAQPIIKVFMGRFLEAWYQLSKEEKVVSKPGLTRLLKK
jgi:hypothetical protein